MEIVGLKLSQPKSPPSFICCEEHGFVYERYCGTHVEACCKMCVKATHDDCSDVDITLEEAVLETCFNEKFDEVTHSLEDLIDKFDAAKCCESEKIQTVDKRGRKVSKMSGVKMKYVKQANGKEHEKVTSTGRSDSSMKCIGEDGVCLCENAIESIKEIMKQATELKQGDPATERKIIAFSKIKLARDKYQGVLDEMATESDDVKPDPLISISDLKPILPRAKSTKVSCQTPTTENVPVNSKTRLETIREVNVASDLDTVTSTVTGCTFLPDGTLVIVDESNTNLKVVPKGMDTVTMVKVLDYSPWDVIYITDNEVAVRSSFMKEKVDKKIHFFQITNTIEEKASINFDGRPRAIAYHDGTIYATVTKKGQTSIVAMSRTGKVLKVIRPKEKFSFKPQYMDFAPNTGTLYISDFNQGIIALSLTGEIRVPNLDGELIEYGGVAIDGKGDVFVCAGLPYGIYKQTKDGLQLEPYITLDENIDPQALTFHKKSKIFLVTCCSSNTAFVFGFVSH